MIKSCEICKKQFKTIQAKINQGNGKFCSRKCYGISKKDIPTWNTGIKTGIIPKSAFKKGNNINNKNINWKGDKAGYLAKHTWIRRKLGFPKYCKICGKHPNKIEIANTNHKYNRNNISEWIPMCTSCHRKFDIREGLIINHLNHSL